MTQKLHNSLIIFHQNVWGSKYKTDKLYISLYPDLLHVLCISERHLNYAHLFGIGIDNYKL